MSMSDQIVADRYATALMGLVGPDSATLDRIDDDLDAIGEILATTPSLSAFLENPRIAAADKKGLVQRVFGERVTPAVLQLMLLLIDKHRERELRGIADRFSRMADERRGVEEAEVISAVPLPPEQLQRLTAEVQRFSSHEVRLKTTIDPSILGGVILRLGNRIIDGSVRHRLQELKRTLQAAQVH